MIAEEARKKALEVKNKEIYGEYETISNDILKEVNKGKFSLVVYSNLKPEVIKILKEEGYKVESFSEQREGSWTTIEW